MIPFSTFQAGLRMAGLIAFSAQLGLGAPEAAATNETRSAKESALAQTVRAHTHFLSDDLLEGRAAGTRGFDLAARYVEAQLRRLGFQPAGDPRAGSFHQPLTFRESLLDLEAGRLVIHADTTTEVVLNPINDTVVRPGSSADAVDFTAEAVFVGFGVHAPLFGYDDFANEIDLRGKIAVVLAGSPSSLPSTARAHFSRRKSAELAGRGAVGVITVLTPAEERRLPWAFALTAARFPSMRLMEPDGTLFEGFESLRGTALVNRAAAGHLFTRVDRNVDAVFATAERNEPQAFPLNLSVRLVAKGHSKTTASYNVLGILPGSDPDLAGEPLVISAHLDHLGVGPEIDGDGLYNGAVDNALGVGAVLAVAEEFSKSSRPRRPVMIAALTAEEKGLLGGYGLARRPPEGVARFAANLNIDMPVILGPTRDYIAFGEAHSTLGAAARRVAARLGATLSPDPKPDEVVFVRSDQYPFVRSGTPALFIKSGHLSTGSGVNLAELEIEYRKTHYHKPSDEITLPIHWESVGAYTAFVSELAREIANDPATPTWLPGDFFGGLYGPGGSEAQSKPTEP